MSNLKKGNDKIKEQMGGDKKEKYISCHDLENGIILFSDGVKHCCGLNSNGIPQEIIPYEDSIEQTVQTIIAKKKQIIQDNIHGKKTFCTDCKSLKKGYWPIQKQIRQINLSLDYLCNLKCRYCSKWETKYICKNRLHIPDLMRQLKNCSSVNLMYPVLYSSGEITIQPEIKSILASLEEYDVCIFSNATKYQQDVASKIKKTANCLVVSLDCGTRATYRRIKGVDLFDIVCQNIEKYCINGGNVIPKYILMEDNIGQDDLNGFIELCVKNSIANIIISRDFNSRDVDKKLKKAAAQLAYKAIKENICFFTDGIYDIYTHVFNVNYDAI